MPDLRNEAGVRVSVSEETAARLGPEWTPVDGEQKKPRGKKTAE